jgi:CRP-like cAMP-binding protein
MSVAREIDVRPPARIPAMHLLSGGAPVNARRGQRVDVSLLALDCEFAAAIPAEDRQLADSALRFPGVVLLPGTWLGPSTIDDAHAILVTDGLLSRAVALGGRSSMELFGPGDIVGNPDTADDLDDERVAWAVHQPARVLVLDDRFVLAGRRWPALWCVLLQRSTARASRLASQLAAMQLSRVEDRVERVLWQLADRWGRVTTEGVILPTTFTHEALGRLVAAKRPTVTVALATLCERGRIIRRIDGSWLLVRRA